jgi:Protein of unknown function (DUF1761)
MNWTSILVSALVPLLIGFVWYSDKGFANVWMREGNLNKEELQKGNLPLLLGFGFLFSFFLSMMMQFIVIHQTGAVAMVGGPTMIKEALPSFNAFMSDYGTVFRTFKHGALHGFMSSILFALPLIAINARFEGKSWKYIFIHAGYWSLTLTVMGAIICGWQ